MHVQSVQEYWFSLSSMQICGFFYCRRRRGCLSSLQDVDIPKSEKPYYRVQGLDKGKPIYDIFKVLNKYACEFKCLA